MPQPELGGFPGLPRRCMSKSAAKRQTRAACHTPNKSLSSIQVQMVLEENKALLESCASYQQSGNLIETLNLHERIHANLMLLGSLDDQLTKSQL